MRGGVSARRETGDGLEDPVEVEPAHAGCLCERVEIRQFLCRLDEAARSCHRPRVPFGKGRLVWAAAPAWPKAGFLGVLTGSVEAHVLASRVPGRTARATIDAGRRDAVDERSNGGMIAIYDAAQRSSSLRNRFATDVCILCASAMISPPSAVLVPAAPVGLRAVMAHPDGFGTTVQPESCSQIVIPKVGIGSLLRYVDGFRRRTPAVGHARRYKPRRARSRRQGGLQLCVS